MKFFAKIVILAVLSALSSPWAIGAYPVKPKLVLMIAIDQFRADYLTRFESRFVKSTAEKIGGFQFLMSQGSYYPLAEYSILQCMTGPGHVTMLSGSLPYRNGIPINVWYNPVRKEREYCVQDSSVENVSDRPLERPMPMSPKNFLGTTVGDELKNAGYSSRVVGIALKDRAAILMTGRRADSVFWHDSASHQWISSSYYFKDKKLPDWVSQINAELAKHLGKKAVWKSNPAATKTGLSQNTSFDHTETIGSYPSFAMPRGAEITTDLAIAAIQKMKLGQGKHPDLLAVSYSAHDYLGHAKGPNALEMEEMTVAEDRELARLFQALEKSLPNGMKDAVIILTGDHGIPPSPEYLAQAGFSSSPRVNDELIKKIVNDAFAKQWKTSEKNWIADSVELNLYLDRAVLEKREVSLESAVQIAKKALSDHPLIASVQTAIEAEKKTFLPGLLGFQWGVTYFASRSGDLVVVPKSLATSGVDGHGVDHLTGYAFDRTVPLIFYGQGIRKQIHPISAKVQDIAPTLSFILGVVPPSLSEGRILSEIFEPLRK